MQLQLQVSLLSRQLQVGEVERQRAHTHNQFLQRRLQQLIHCSAATASDLAALRSVHSKLTGQLGCQLSASPAVSAAVSAVPGPGHQHPSKQSREDKESGGIMEVNGAEEHGSDKAKAMLRARTGSTAETGRGGRPEVEGHDQDCSHIQGGKSSGQEDGENKMQIPDQKMHW